MSMTKNEVQELRDLMDAMIMRRAALDDAERLHAQAIIKLDRFLDQQQGGK